MCITPYKEMNLTFNKPSLEVNLPGVCILMAEMAYIGSHGSLLRAAGVNGATPGLTSCHYISYFVLPFWYDSAKELLGVQGM